MGMNINTNYGQFFKGTESINSYGTGKKKDTLVKYEFNTADETGNKVMDKMSREETLKAMKDISMQYGENAIVEFSGDGLAALAEFKKGMAFELTEEQKAERAEREASFQKSIVQLEGLYKFNLTDEEACLMKSFRLEEYYSIRERMKEEAPKAYNELLKASDEADVKHDPSAKFKVFASAYNWAYGDVFDRIHKENPDVDIYVKSAGTSENHNYRMNKNRKSIIITTDEIKLLQSKREADRQKQDELWRTIQKRIQG